MDRNSHKRSAYPETSAYTSIPISSSQSLDAAELGGFPSTPYSIDELINRPSMPHRKIRRKGHSRSRTTASDMIYANREPDTSGRRNTIQMHLRTFSDNLKQVQDLRKMPKHMMKTLAPTRIPMIERWVNWCSTRWPGHPRYKFILHSPYFFLYVISMALVQALIAAVAIDEIVLFRNFGVGTLISTVFFILYICEVALRIYVKGFEFFLQIYNIAEVSLTLSAFILDFQLVGTSFVANVLSLRIIWCIHKVPGMAFVLEGLRIAAPRISIIFFPLLILIYVFAVVATTTLGPNSYEYPSPDYWKESYQHKLPNGTFITVTGANLNYDYYGGIAASMFTLFQVMTGDGWSGDIARPTMVQRPWSFILFIIFYSLFAFVLLNIFTGIMVDAIQSFEKVHKSDNDAKKIRKKLDKENRRGSKSGSVSVDGDGNSSMSDGEGNRNEPADFMEPAPDLDYRRASEALSNSSEIYV
eukprot:Partr_v1_DN28352_c3_g1_i1_m79295